MPITSFSKLLQILLLSGVCLLGGLFVTPLTGVSKTVVLTTDQVYHRFNDKQIDAFFDPTNQLELSNILEQPNRFQPYPGALVVNAQKGTLWVKMDFVLKSQDIHHWNLLVGNSMLDSVELFYQNPQGEWIHKQDGRLFPRSLQKVSYRYANFSLTFPQNQPQSFYLKIQAERNTITWFIMRDLDRNVLSELWNLGLGAFYGILVMIALYNGLLAFNLKDPTYGYYAAYLLCLCWTSMQVTGTAFLYAWPEFPLLNRWLTDFSWALTQFSGFVFVYYFLQVSQYVPSFKNPMRIICWLPWVIWGLTSYQPSWSNGIEYFPLFFIPLIIWLGWYCWKQGHRSARYFVWAWTFWLLGILPATLANLDLIPFDSSFVILVQVGSVLEIVFLSLALMDRINFSRQEQDRIQQEALAQQKEMTQSFARFVPLQFLGLLNRKDYRSIQLGDAVEQKMTILFSDIRSFTSLTEQLSPQGSFEFINSYLHYIEPVIEKNGGFIDKYIGDAVMALFPGNAQDAVQAAIEMQQALEHFNQERQAQGLPAIQVGIGINTGLAMLGVIGSSKRMENTVMSDAVNVSARIENLNKVYGTNLLVSEQTYQELASPSTYSSRIIDHVVVKGKQETITVYEICDGDSEATKHQKQAIQSNFELGVSLFHQGKLREAKTCFEQCLQIAPDDSVALLYLQRCQIT